MLFQKSRWCFLLNSLLHNNLHFISLDYFEHSLGLHYFTFLYVGVKLGILIMIYLKKMFRLFNGWCLHKKLKHWLDYAWMLQWMVLYQTLKTPQSYMQVTHDLECRQINCTLSGRDFYQWCSPAWYSPFVPMKITGCLQDISFAPKLIHLINLILNIPTNRLCWSLYCKLNYNALTIILGREASDC